MTLVNTTSPVTFSEGQSVKLGRKTYTVADAISHGVAEYDAICLLQAELDEKLLPKWKYLGDLLNQIRSLFPEGKKGGTEFRKYIEDVNNGLSVIPKDQRYDAMAISANWTLVQRLNKNGKLDSLGLSAIRKRINQETKPKAEPKAQKSTGNVSKGKKAERSIPKGIAVSEAELAKFVVAQIEAEGLDFKKFVTELTALRQKG